MSIDARVRDLSIRIATECKSIRMLMNGNGADLTGLSTTAKTSLVAAVNELKASLNALSLNTNTMIDDTTTTSGKVWSGQKVQQELSALHNQMTNDSAAAMETLNELTAALANDDNAVAALNTAISARLRVDAPQALTPTEQTQALTNLGAVSSANVGPTNTDYVAIFNTGLLS